jgi:hypothetical protein
MLSRSHSQIRHCPVCGIAMQASKSRDDLRNFDIFSCLSCDTTVEVKRRPPEGNADES